MKKIIDLCEAKGTKILILSTPSPQNSSYKKHNALQEFTEEFSLDYLNLNFLLDEMGIDWETDSLDEGDHLNLSGACKVTEYLGRYLNANYDLPVHRSDSIGEAWEEEYDEYRETVQETLETMQLSM
jgi:hypothetical protein